MPQFLSLPQPITIAPGPSAGPAPVRQQTQQQGTGSPSTSTGVPIGSPPELPSATAAQIPAADLKPLYDFIQDCRACQAQLAAAKQNASDDATKITALTVERNAAVTAARGGTFWRRLRRNAAWFAVGAAIGAAAGYRASHR